MPRGLLRSDGVWVEAEITREMLGLGGTVRKPVWVTTRISDKFATPSHAITYVGQFGVYSIVGTPVYPLSELSLAGDGAAIIYAYDRYGDLVDYNPALIHIATLAPAFPRPHTLTICGKTSSTLRVRKIDLMGELCRSKQEYKYHLQMSITVKDRRNDGNLWPIANIYVTLLSNNDGNYTKYIMECTYNVRGSARSQVQCYLDEWGIAKLSERHPDAYIYISYSVDSCNVDISRTPGVADIFGYLLDDEESTILLGDGV